jgi:hypothetical protein
MRAFLSRALRATRILVRDGRVPRPLRWLAAVALLPIPGPVDEAVLVLLAPILLAFHRGPMREAWEAAGPEGRAPRARAE